MLLSMMSVSMVTLMLSSFWSCDVKVVSELTTDVPVSDFSSIDSVSPWQRRGGSHFSSNDLRRRWQRGLIVDRWSGWMEVCSGERLGT